MKYLLIVLATMMISACDDNNDSSPPDCIDCIWLQSSQRVVITQEGGIGALPREVIADYSRDSLPAEALRLLESLERTAAPFDQTQTDVFIYHLVITDEHGLEYEYHDNWYLNVAPTEVTSDWLFFERSDIEKLIEVLAQD
ncbi:hypothetical protein OLMES_2438 [Oleiphilus messinensis]|uniref:Lipoprotein n=1 Tax=Oleiphilus messinensis TaxID=141451 RepID=A0A1Y0I8H2_9GAMM|nr:hypothetical protein [Oleiphilus messinensis]ARU56499.1 hypothetical protein OLMES_2438 [Oleiphilus messinensis]